jgi:hypothetical protein
MKKLFSFTALYKEEYIQNASFFLCSAGKYPSVPTTIVEKQKDIMYSFGKYCWYVYSAFARLHTNNGVALKMQPDNLNLFFSKFEFQKIVRNF